MSKLILMRHGMSVWNEKNIFTGWVDIPLDEKGIEEAIKAGKEMAEEEVDIIFTSALVRAHMTCFIAMAYNKSDKVCRVFHPEDKLHKGWDHIYSDEETIPTIMAWQLNERMYGELQGMHKDFIKKTFGDEKFNAWRRSYDTSPPKGESLQQTAQRTVPYFQDVILKHIENGKNVFICAHGNSLRALTMYLEGKSGKEISSLEIPTAHPIIYQYIDGNFVKS
ncbi:MAG: 2,3-bisphosphoglycerate-dependent phosphoglycerate mutase [Chlamydiae bacterium]|nr:2,3-bisphosphoglycerate-dependent phosphoglycerate mutase [Chlamydiota bacterium]